MALQTERQSVEVENLIGARSGQVLLRAEALVPGAGRDAIEPLLADASLFIARTDLQADRVVIEGVPAADKTRIMEAITELEAGGSTNGSAGIIRAYEIAEKYYRK